MAQVGKVIQILKSNMKKNANKVIKELQLWRMN